MKDMSDCNKNNNQDVNLKEEKLFRAMSGVDEDLLLRSEQIRNSGRVHKFPMRYVTRIAAACLCFVVAGVLYMTMSSTKMADSTGNADTAAPQMAYGITEDQEIQEAAAMAEAEAAMPESEAAEDSANMAEMTDSASTDSGQQAASGNSIDGQKQSGLESALSVSGNESSQDSTEAAPEEDGILKKKERQLPKKMTVKGQ
jgi:bifunctional ADP-heptose synthase (sugar kinase/adenylyltransferase)